jgi:predicted membrane protein
MIASLATIFLNPLPLPGVLRTLSLLPLCLAIAIVYKTTRCARVREIPLASLILWVTIVAGMYAVGVGLLVMYELLA